MLIVKNSLTSVWILYILNLFQTKLDKRQLEILMV